MTEINKFNLSKIYVIKSLQTDLYYIGSTTQPLGRRFSTHKSNYKGYLSGTYHFVTSFKIIEHDDAYIELLEEVNCENRKELEKREGDIIKERKSLCVNRIIVGRTKSEWTYDNIDKIKEQKKQYFIDNSDKLKQHSTQYYIDNCDRIKAQVNQYRIDNLDKIKQYRIDNLDKIRDKDKQFRIDNADKIREQKKQYRIDNSTMLNEKRRIKYAETKLLKDLAMITI